MFDQNSHTRNLAQLRLERHVKESLSTAMELAQGQPISARHVLEAALIVNLRSDFYSRSPAFSKWASFFSSERINLPNIISTSDRNMTAVPFNRFMAAAFDVAEPFFRKKDDVWGRDYITFALLASGDPSLNEISTIANSSIEALQDSWFQFVTADDSRRARESWIDWWRMAGVPLPDERQSIRKKSQSSRRAYLLTWDPERHTADYLKDAIQESEGHGFTVLKWNVGNHGITRGDRVFFMRHCEDMPGLIGAGHVDSDITEGPHWDKSKIDWTAYYADIRWDILREFPVIPLKVLIQRTGESRLWTTQGSGIAIPESVAEQLEILLKDKMPRQSESISPGPSTHITTDIWTLDDTLGYRPYAYAIYRFMTHNQTKPPLTISIQAPWGGGKTSLMRMIQKLLDPGALNTPRGPIQRNEDLTTKEALQEIDKWSHSEKKDLPTIPKDESRKLLTVWFNAWKYESTNQVWAGLADAIMKQVADRLSPVEKERYWLRLNLGRVDTEKVRLNIHDRILTFFWNSARNWIFGSGLLLFISMAVTLIGWLNNANIVSNLGWSGLGSISLIGALLNIKKYMTAKQNVEKEPASVTLKDYIDIPEYNKELGFVHNVEADLHRVLASVPKEHRPIVIFIDDLDRCSPAKVAQVLEAVNLFLAGDFPDCMFVLGMDSEMVAASLQSAHKDMLTCLPSDASIPLGWRFMDKFVQLPFIIPPAEDNEIQRYTRSLFSVTQEVIPEPAMKHALDRAEFIQSKSDVAVEIAELHTRHDLSDVQRNYLQEQMEMQVIKNSLDRGIETFTDDNPEIKGIIATATSYFYGNPRELKRFVNVFRFNYFIWWARRAQQLESPTLDQLLRWTVLTMKWPEIVRWLRRCGGNDWCLQTVCGQKDDGIPTQTSRLKLIETISGESSDLNTWQEKALKVLRLTTKEAPWLDEAQILRFFHEEHKEYREGQRLSDGEGKGLW